MKSRQRRSFSAEMKARIALEEIKEQKTIQEIASHYGVHPSQVTNWKRQAIQGAPELFADRSEEHTSELQSHLNLVCRLLLEKKKQSDVRKPATNTLGTPHYLPSLVH